MTRTQIAESCLHNVTLLYNFMLVFTCSRILLATISVMPLFYKVDEYSFSSSRVCAQNEGSAKAHTHVTRRMYSIWLQKFTANASHTLWATSSGKVYISLSSIIRRVNEFRWVHVFTDSALWNPAQTKITRWKLNSDGKNFQLFACFCKRSFLSCFSGNHLLLIL